jgi:hypothetical protein
MFHPQTFGKTNLRLDVFLKQVTFKTQARISYIHIPKPLSITLAKVFPASLMINLISVARHLLHLKVLFTTDAGFEQLPAAI